MRDETAARIAAAQLAGVSRSRRVVTVPPFVGLMTRTGPAFMSYVVAERPGEPVRELGESLKVLRAEFAPHPVRFELIDEASPGAVDALLGAGLTESGRFPLLTLNTAELITPPESSGATISVSTTKQDANDAQRVASSAFESELGGEVDAPGDPAGGGSVLARMGDRAVATAFWTAVDDGVSEIAGVATLPRFRRPGSRRGEPGLDDARPRRRGSHLPAGGVRADGDRGASCCRPVAILGS
jgi:hypothetical protein